VAVLVDFRPTGKLRGSKPVDVTAALGPVVDALAEDSVDLSRVRVVCDWVQYRNSFRDVVDIRPILATYGHSSTHGSPLTPVPLAAMVTEDEMEVAIDVRRRYEQALPGGESDARNRDGVREIIAGLFARWDSLVERNALPDELYVVALGVSNGSQAKTWLDEFVALDSDHGADYYRRLHYLMCDYSPCVLELARTAVADHAQHVSSFVLGFLRYKVFLVYISNVYDNLPTDEVAQIGGHTYIVQTRAYLPRDAAAEVAQQISTLPAADRPGPLPDCAAMTPVLPTTVVGSSSVPEWFERLKTDYYRNRISRTHLGEIHDMAIKAALKDQETAPLGLAGDYCFTRQHTAGRSRFPSPGPSCCPVGSRTKRIRILRTWFGRWRTCSTLRRGRWPGRVRSCCRSTSRFWLAIPRMRSSRWRRSTL
jgi:hypothetical protein